ncbi:MAG: hypothetical protein IPJ65_14405 [Archangiaceae bacterium]|nr:hypothetical protein [Archangiaceae bacterium]
MRACLALALLGLSCAPPAIAHLEPDPNPMPETDPLWSPQPTRDRPRAACVSTDGRRAWVMLGGTEDAPGEELAVVDLEQERVLRRRRLGRSPWACAVDPAGRWLVVLLRYSDHALVLDTRDEHELARVKVPFYTEALAFTPDGRRLYLANRWKDSVLWWELRPAERFEVVSTSYDGKAAWEPMGTPVPANPTSLQLSSDGRWLFAGAAAGVATAVLDARTGELVDADADPGTTTLGAPEGITFLSFNSPVGGLAANGPWLFIADVGPGTGALPRAGADLDLDGEPGDGTGNVIFQDLQNELVVVDTRTFEVAHRYTSDSLCCRDFRDVDPDRPARGLDLPEPDTWSPEVVGFLPPKATWIVAGALPEALAVLDGDLWVAYAGSNEVQGFAIGEGGALSPLQGAGALYPTGYNPKALAVAGPRLLSVDRLGESVTLIDPAQPPGHERRIVVGDETAGPFPMTDAELGEGVNEMTAAFTVDGDQTCVHCHRDNGAIARPIVMPLLAHRAWGARNIMAQRGLYDTRPWFIESAMDEVNFFPVINEFARRENYCCEGFDPTVWSRYPSAATCLASPALEGCGHVLRCREDPPPECAERGYGGTQLTRSEAFRAAARSLFGRDQTFGDALGGPIALDFSGVTRALGLFMLRTPRLLPNPNRHLQLPSADRGAALFQDPQVGCGACHPLPLTTTASLPRPFSPSGLPVRFPPVVTPSLTPDGADASKVTDGFLETFPDTLQSSTGLRIGATVLRGLWDRPHTRLLHDGRARSLREVLAPPATRRCARASSAATSASARPTRTAA